jgi:hypothetical protein
VIQRAQRPRFPLETGYPPWIVSESGRRAANRANAQESTGPRTTAGKAASCFNALKHGIYAVHQIMFDEKPRIPPSIASCTAPPIPRSAFLVDTLGISH